MAGVMDYISLFSGMECAWAAWHRLGWTCKAVAEIDPRACEVLAWRVNASQPKYLPVHVPAWDARLGRMSSDPFPRKAYAHLPPFGTPGTVPNFGDVSQVTDDDIAALGHVDVLIGGSPCQDLSNAGKRRGLAGARSGLFHQQLRIFHAARHFCGARWLVWENVPGAFSSNVGRDFAVVVGSMAGLELAVPRDGWGTEGVAVGDNGLVEWCVLDAQWFGVAQRRRRVFAVLDTGDWSRRAPVLLERDRLRGDSAPRREAGENPAQTISARASGGGGLGTDFELDGGLIPDWPADVACTLNAAFGDKQGLEDQHALSGASLFVPVLANALTAHNGQRNEVSDMIHGLVAHTLRGEGFDASEDGTGRGTPLVPVYADDIAPTLTSGPTSPASHGKKSGTDREALIAFSCKDHGADAGDVSPTLRSMGHDGSHANAGGQVAVAFAQNQRDEVRVMDVVGALAAEPGARQQTCLQQAMAVRRLTPRECERLQGVEDDWTLVPSGRSGKPMADGPRYKMLGNSFARPVITWIGQQLERATAESAR